MTLENLVAKLYILQYSHFNKNNKIIVYIIYCFYFYKKDILKVSKIYENRIKNNKPKNNSRYHQGYVPQRFCSKLFQSVKGEPIIYRSGLELQFIQFCENNPKIKQWASEPIAIRYTCRLDNNEHDYYPDYVIETYDGHKIIVEVKPYSQTVKPGSLDSRWLKESWIKNCDKWKAANEFAHRNNAKFIIVTEKFFE